MARSSHKADASTLLSREKEEISMKKTRGGRMTAAKKRAAKTPGGKGPVSKRAVGRKIKKT
jgi:hypothetical protein